MDQEGAATEARRREIEAERAKIYEKRDAAIKAGRRVEVQRAEVQRALGGDWAGMIVLLRQTRPTAIREALMYIEDTEEGQRRTPGASSSAPIGRPPALSRPKPRKPAALPRSRRQREASQP